MPSFFLASITTEPVRSQRSYEKVEKSSNSFLPISHLLSDLTGSVVIDATTPKNTKKGAT
jgi:hypothetical protein